MAESIVTKQCQKCKQTLPEVAFHRHKSRPDGRQEVCKACRAAYFLNTYKSRSTADTSELPGEEWRPIQGYEGYYSVSSLGRVRRDNKRPGAVSGRILRCQINGVGYRIAHLSKENISKAFTVHSLVAGAFIGPRPERLTVNHKDGVKLNNQPANLEYVTVQQNCLHAVRNRLRTDYSRPFASVPRGQQHANAKLTNADVLLIRQLLRDGRTHRSLAAEFGVSKSLIYAIKSGTSWRRI